MTNLSLCSEAFSHSALDVPMGPENGTQRSSPFVSLFTLPPQALFWIIKTAYAVEHIHRIDEER